MLKKLLLAMIFVLSFTSVVNAEDKYLDLRKDNDIDKIGWVVFKLAYYNNILDNQKWRKIFFKWYLKTYYSNEIEKYKDDEFALNDFIEKKSKEFYKKMDLIKSKGKWYNASCDKDFIFKTKGKLLKYDFEKGIYIIAPIPFKTENAKLKLGKDGNAYYIDYNTKNRKLVKKLEILFPARYGLKIDKEKAKILYNKYKDKELLLEYKIADISLKQTGGDYKDRVGPWMNLIRSPHEGEKVKIIDPETNSTIGVAEYK